MLIQDYQNKKQKRQQLQSAGMQSAGMQSAGMQSTGMQSAGMQSAGMQAGQMMSGINSAPGNPSFRLLIWGWSNSSANQWIDLSVDSLIIINNNDDNNNNK